ncbi:hypothetical protein ACIRCZ_19780 [Leifsonia sp. NPDC102414]|uniref:hypothetical protein n=1 Tax=Leifsonia sp. NPDC102414 TaxID=3364124 RepID=UPI00380B8C47
MSLAFEQWVEIDHVAPPFVFLPAEANDPVGELLRAIAETMWQWRGLVVRRLLDAGRVELVPHVLADIHALAYERLVQLPIDSDPGGAVRYVKQLMSSYLVRFLGDEGRRERAQHAWCAQEQTLCSSAGTEDFERADFMRRLLDHVSAEVGDEVVASFATRVDSGQELKEARKRLRPYAEVVRAVMLHVADGGGDVSDPGVFLPEPYRSFTAADGRPEAIADEHGWSTAVLAKRREMATRLLRLARHTLRTELPQN